MIRLLLPLAMSFLLFGCTTVRVDKVESIESGDGVRYSLPKPVLFIQVMKDGTLDVRVEMFPDERHTYAIQAKSYLASHELLVKTHQGLLTAVEWTADSSVVGAEVAKAAGEVQKARQEAEVALAKAEREKADKDAKESEGRIAAKEEELAKASVEAQVAFAELQFYGAGDESDEKKKADLKHRAAVAKVAALEEQLASLKGAAPTGVGARRVGDDILDDENLDTGGERGGEEIASGSSEPLPEGFKAAKVYGPLLLQIDESKECFKLAQIDPGQQEFAVYAAIKSGSGQSPAEINTITHDLGKISKKENRVDLEKPLRGSESCEITGPDGQSVLTGSPLVSKASDTRFTVIFPSEQPRNQGHPVGSSRIECSVLEDGKAHTKVVITYEVE